MKRLSVLLAKGIWVLGILLLHKAIWAQSPNRIYRNLTTLQMQQALEASDSSIVLNRNQIERFTDSVENLVNPSSKTLPIVFHILNKVQGHKLIPESQVEAQILALNRDFNNQDYAERHLADTREGFNLLVADMEISFCLADLSGNGGLPAIHYVNGLQEDWPPNNSVKDPSVGGIAPWFPEEVINVWVADLTEDVSGFAQMPGGPSSTDGIVIDYRFFGTGTHTETPYNQGKTLTHLMGNYLNLYDLWGQGPLCSDDGVDDTPIHNSINSRCPSYKHMTTCQTSSVEMTMNFMDNTDDPCMYMFTEGQKRRVQALFHLEGPKVALSSSSFSSCDSIGNLRLTDPNSPLENFPAEQIFVYPNPTQENFHLGFSATKKGKIEVNVFSTIGTQVYQNSFSIQEGYQEFVIKSQSWTSGIYFIQTLWEEKSETLQLTIK